MGADAAGWNVGLLMEVVEPGKNGQVYIPHSRIADSFSARQIGLQLLDNDRLRARERARVQGLLDGNPPYDPSKLRSMGQGWRSNLNFMEGYANLQSVKTPYFALIASVPYFAEIRTLVSDVQVNSEIITEEFTSLIKRWQDFSWQMQKAQQEMLKFGVGPVLTSDPYDWRFQALRHRELLVPEHSPGIVSKWPFFAIRCEMTASDIWDKVRPANEKHSKEIGWNVDLCRMAVMYASRDFFNGRITWDSRNWEYWQDAFKNNDIYMSLMQAQSLMVYHLFVREYSGRISHFIVSENAILDGFMFKRIDRYEKMEEVLTIFRSDIGGGDYHSIRGIGRLQYQHVEVTNRLKNHLFDMAMAGTAINLKPNTTKARDELQLLQLGPVNILPPDVELVQNRVVGFLTDAMTVDRDFTTHLNANLGTFRRPGVGYGNQQTRPTATQVQSDIVTTSQLSEGQVVLHFLDLDLLYGQMYWRASDPNTPDEEAKKFQKSCLDRGVPALALRKIKFIRASRVAGYGSPQMRQVNAQQMTPYMGMLPEVGRQNWVRDQVISIVGPENLERYFPSQGAETDDAWMANIENGVMASGQHVMIPSSLTGSGHSIHTNVHLTQIEQLLQHADQIYSDQGAPVQSSLSVLANVQQFVQICLPHAEAHMQLLSFDPMHQNELKGYQQRVNGISNNMQQITAIIEQGQEAMAAQQSAQQSAQTKDQIKLAQAQSEIQIDRALAASKIQNQRIKAMSQIQTAQQKAAAKPPQERQRLQEQVAEAGQLGSPIQPAGLPEEEGEEIPFS